MDEKLHCTLYNPALHSIPHLCRECTCPHRIITLRTFDRHVGKTQYAICMSAASTSLEPLKPI